MVLHIDIILDPIYHKILHVQEKDVRGVVPKLLPFFSVLQLRLSNTIKSLRRLSGATAEAEAGQKDQPQPTELIEHLSLILALKSQRFRVCW